LKQVVFKELRFEHKAALLWADQAKERAYCPYSGFYVGACLIGLDGGLVSGANFESASYGLTVCAERCAVFNANIIGMRQFQGVAIIARGKSFDTKEVTGPCGACRQILYEVSQLSGRDLDIVLSTTQKDKIIVTSINELLPLGFGPLDPNVNLEEWKKSDLNINFEAWKK